jgi:hypothetical protein
MVDFDNGNTRTDVDEETRELRCRLRIEEDRVLGRVWGRTLELAVELWRTGLVRMGDLEYELIRVPKDLVWNLGDESQSCDQTVHFLLAADFDAELSREQIME